MLGIVLLCKCEVMLQCCKNYNQSCVELHEFVNSGKKANDYALYDKSDVFPP